MQNNCTQFSLRLDKMHHISPKEFITAVFFNLSKILEFAPQYRIEQEIVLQGLTTFSIRLTRSRKSYRTICLFVEQYARIH